MPALPQRHSLVPQLAEILRREIAAGTWTEWLPRETELCKTFQVSRSTLRAALGVVRDEKRIETLHGTGTRVLKRGAKSTPVAAPTSIGVLTPRALYHFRHFVTLVIDDLRTLLIENGFRLSVHESATVATGNPDHALRRTTGQHRHACWLLLGCSPATLTWFSNHHVPAVVSGTCDPAVGLPFVCLDNRALGRHAAAVLQRHGHRRVAALLTRSNPGLRLGLRDGFTADGDSRLTLCELDGEVESVARTIDRLFRAVTPPTALFIAESGMYLAALSRLAQIGRRVPQDVSLLCRDDEPYLASMLPAPARYSKDPHLYARRLLAHLLLVAAHKPVPNPRVWIMPEFVGGGSLGRPAT